MIFIGVVGMNKNHFICNMVEALSLQQHTGIPCSHCEQTSVGRCVTCELFMCESCLQSHNGYVGFKDHEVLRIEELSKPENRKKMKGRSYCKKHSSKKLKLYCETCDELICTYCMSFDHVRPGHVCFILEEIAEQKREKLKTLCLTLDNHETRNSQVYDDLKSSTLCLENDLRQVKNRIHQTKNNILEFLKKCLDKKATSLIKKAENIARFKHEIIDEELKRIADHMEGQKRTYTIAKSLLDTGTNEEIMLSYKSVQQSVNNDEMKHERKDMDTKLPNYNKSELDRIFYDE